MDVANPHLRGRGEMLLSDDSQIGPKYVSAAQSCRVDGRDPLCKVKPHPERHVPGTRATGPYPQLCSKELSLQELLAKATLFIHSRPTRRGTRHSWCMYHTCWEPCGPGESHPRTSFLYGHVTEHFSLCADVTCSLSQHDQKAS